MKNWLIPIAVLGVSGLGLLFASENGREQVRDCLSGWLSMAIRWANSTVS